MKRLPFVFLSLVLYVFGYYTGIETEVEIGQFIMIVSCIGFLASVVSLHKAIYPGKMK